MTSTTMETSEQIEKKIKTIETDIDNLQKRCSSIDQELGNIKKDVANNLDNPETEKRIGELTSNREIIIEVIQEKEEKLEQLEAQLKEAEAREKREAQFQKLVELAQEADEASREYRELFEDLDHELMDKLITIAKKQREWGSAAKQFANIAEQIEPAVKVSHDPADSSRSELENAAKSLIEKVEAKGVNTGAVLSEIYVKERYYRVSKRNGRDLKPDTDHFGWAIYEMLDKVKKQLQDQADKSAA